MQSAIGAIHQPDFALGDIFVGPPQNKQVAHQFNLLFIGSTIQNFTPNLLEDVEAASGSKRGYIIFTKRGLAIE